MLSSIYKLLLFAVLILISIADSQSTTREDAVNATKLQEDASSWLEIRGNSGTQGEAFTIIITGRRTNLQEVDLQCLLKNGQHIGNRGE